MSDLLPCPFCGCQLVVRHTGWFDHPKRKCILSGKAFHKGFIGQWNNRADLPPTLSAARELPEVRALVDALREIIIKDTRPQGGGMCEPFIGACGRHAAAALAAIKEPKT